jgi:Bacterial Ig domain/Glucodextranase, domain B/Abnormal spindle-like microcephaly-assoc'd, ASPM-SPD-2-Hydin/Fibronectin type III domain
MPGKNVRSAVTCVGLAFILSEVLLVTTPGTAGILDATWTAPTTNTDGSPLTDLASYRLYYSTASSPCPGSSSVPVASPTSSPGPNLTMSYRLTGLTSGTLYNVAVSAVDAAGSQSSCSSIASAIARAEFAVSPTGTVNFGSVNLGSFAEQTFTVSNTGGGTVSGSASVAAPFSISSGSPFTLSGVGATQAVTVRFTPTTTTTVSTTLTLAAAGSTISAIVTGSGAGAVTTPPTVTITSPTSSPTYTATSSSLTLQGTASDPVGVTQVTWVNSRGGSGSATGTTSWTASAIALQLGSNVLAVTARDAAGYTKTASLTVTLGDTTSPTVAVTAPVAGTTVTSTVVVSGSATDNVGVAGVQFKLDGANLGAEVTTSPYAVTWNTTTIADGDHVLTAVARDAAGNRATSPGVPVTVANTNTGGINVTAPLISKASLSVTSTSAAIGWTTNKPSDTQVEIGLPGSDMVPLTLDTTLVTSHLQKIINLAPNTWYQFRMKSKDVAGNLAVSPNYKFKTRPR